MTYHKSVTCSCLPSAGYVQAAVASY